MSSLTGTVRVVGAGLLGTSIGLALTKLGIDVAISSKSQKSIDLAVEYGAGRAARPDDQPILSIVCVPPVQTAQLVAEELIAFPNAFVTDVASVKVAVLEELDRLKAPIERYAGSHPMAGRERSGAIAGRADLFVGRPWVIAAHATSSPIAVALLKDLAEKLESAVVELTPEDHDRAVALVSHAPQIVSTLLANRLNDAALADVQLAGQGLRDTTRIAASDPELWVQIIEANTPQVLKVLKKFDQDLDLLIAQLESGKHEGKLHELLVGGNTGVEKIPGKHGTKHSNYARVVVMIDDKPGEFARLFTEVGRLGINLEELKLEHSPSAQIGLIELYVVPEVEQKLIDDLQAQGWRIA